MRHHPNVQSYIIEEHHEAFFAWSLLCGKESDSFANCTLLHVDEHADMSKPRPSVPLPAPDCRAKELLCFTQNNLCIDDFILAGAYQGFFHQVCWMRRDHATMPSDTVIHLASESGQGKRFFLCDSRMASGLLDPHRHTSVELLHATPANSPQIAAPMLLDIDLDYFHSDDANANAVEIEITEQEFLGFQNNPYHKLRMSNGNLQAIEQNGSYYYLINKPKSEAQATFDHDQISRRMDQLLQCLAKLPVPVGITICRSRFSGYTPAEHCLWIESALIEALQTLYPMDIHTLFDAGFLNESR